MPEICLSPPTLYDCIQNGAQGEVIKVETEIVMDRNDIFCQNKKQMGQCYEIIIVYFRIQNINYR